MKPVLRLTAVAAFLVLLFYLTAGSEKDTMKTAGSILAFGDSITYGYMADADESYPAVLQSLIGLNVINAGVNGETSEAGTARFPSLLEDDTIGVIILCTGANDILQQRSMPRLKSNLEYMISLAREKGIKVLLIGVPFFGSFELSSLPLYKEVAEKEHVAYMPDLLPDVLEDRTLRSDNVHPNAAGYRYMAEAIAQKLRRERLIN